MPDAAATLLPPNSTALERVIDALVAERMAGIETAYRAWWSAADCPAADLPWLAWALSVDEWDPAWTEAVRRAQIARAIDLQRKKGTVAGITAIVGGFGGQIAMREWWQQIPPGDPHTFELQIALSSGGAAPAAEFIDSVVRAVSAAKPLRSHFTFTVAQNFIGSIGLRGAARAAVLVRASVIGIAADGPPPPPPEIPPTALTLSADPLTLDGDYLTLGA